MKNEETMICPICGNEYLPIRSKYIDKERRNNEIKRIAKGLEGKQKKVVLFKIIAWLKQQELRMCRSQIYEVLKKK